ncbi:jerky protein homolog-like [Phlebotomus papatasi]|uniref:jerky protein homolog-like n=1 Tax=Phlebotomus papatasi TaxID=29031 RepID=UPI002483E5F7|nr:jerky protein homolog-like [Phlebotomus papatasi]
MRTTTDIKDKVKAVELVRSGESIASVAANYRVNRTTVVRWTQNYADLKASLQNFSGKKSRRPEDHPNTSEALSLWYFYMRDKGVPMQGYLLQEKARQYHQIFKDGRENFCASAGWLDRWKKRLGIRQLAVCGESLSSREDQLPEFMERFQNIVQEEGLSYEQLYNADETGLYWRKLPNKTLVEKDRKSAPGFKVSKERVTVLACANASGSHKLPLYVIGKSARPRCFRNLQNVEEELGVKYGGQNACWMTKVSFWDWFFNDAVPQIEEHLDKCGLPRKAILLLDNAPVHPAAEELVSGGIKVLYLPPNCTATVQPMDQNVLEALKRKYRRSFIRFLLRELEDGDDLMSAIKKVNLLRAIHWLRDAWDEVERKTIVRSWKNLLAETFAQVDQESTLQGNKARLSDEFIDFCQLMESFPVSKQLSQKDIQEWFIDHMVLTNKEIIEIVRETFGDPPESPFEVQRTEQVTNENEQNISLEKGVKILEKALMFAKQERQCDPRISMLQEMKNETVLKMMNVQ